MKSEMMAAVLYGKEHLQVEPVAVPEIDRGDILVRVQVALTCGTDVKVFRRGYHARMIVPPAVFGHELAGDVVALGPEVTGFTKGQRVVAATRDRSEGADICGVGAHAERAVRAEERGAGDRVERCSCSAPKRDA